MKIKFTLFFIVLSIFGWSQNLDAIKKEVKAINLEKNYKIKVVPNDYFVEVKNEATDNGQELQGFYNNVELKKIVHTVGLSAWNIVIEYFFNKKQLIFVNETKYLMVDENGFLEKSKIIFEGRYYFKNGKLIHKIEKGEDSDNFDFIKQSEILKRVLKNYK